MKFNLRSGLMSWQWSDYHAKHQNKVNLLVHLAFVPLFWIGLIQFLISLFVIDYRLFLGLGLMFLSFLAQGFGHKQEIEAPAPFLNKADFIARFFCEQIITFPRFVLTGKWFKVFGR